MTRFYAARSSRKPSAFPDRKTAVRRETMEPCISVIVPVYKVEGYIRRCVESILAQTYRNLEVLLIDDGSPDGSGGICDEFAAKDSRVTVIHQENGGVSSARNAGLRRASGDWIAWVDSDDWVEPDFLQYLLTNAQDSGADIVICGMFEEYRKRRLYIGPGDRLLDREEALEALLTDTVVRNYLWDKLWRAELFRDLTFPEGRTFEDIALMWRLFDRADRIKCCPEGKYHYRMHGSGIVGNTALRNKLDYYRAIRERHRDLAPRYPQFQALLEETCARAAVGVWCCYYKNPKEDRARYREQIAEIAAYVRQHPPGEALLQSSGPTGRMVMRLSAHDAWWAFALAGAFGWLYRLKHGRDL